MSIKEVRTKILLALLLMSNDDFAEVDIDERLLYFFSISKNRKLKITLSALIVENRIQTVNKASSDMYILTSQGYDELIHSFPLFRFIKAQWDMKWRILSYEIPESKRELRDKLRRKVTQWGLGPWHRSFWITPHPIIPSLISLLSKSEEEKYVQAFESDHVFGDRSSLIEKVWGISKLESTYRSLFKKWHHTLSETLSERDKLRSIVNEYVEVLKIDPGLPKELIGANWIGIEAMKLFREIRNILLTTK